MPLRAERLGRGPRGRRDATTCQYLVLTPHYLEVDGRANVYSDVAVAEGLGGALRNEPRACRRRGGRPKGTPEPIRPATEGQVPRPNLQR